MTEPARPVNIWDLPTRLFHWLLVALVALQYATGEYHLLDMRWHLWLGYATLTLVLFRVLWGFFGSQTSRFADFVRAPSAVLRHVRATLNGTTQQSGIGYNALGGWSVVAMLTCLLVQSISGLFASDDVATRGPFADALSEGALHLATRIHNWNQSLLLLLIGGHVVAVLLHLLRHDNLIVPMITGRKLVANAPELRFVATWRALLLLVLCAAVIAVVVWSAG